MTTPLEKYRNKIVVGDAATVLKCISSDTVDCIVTSPPYDNARTYGTKNMEWDFESIACEMYRILKPGGVLCWNVNDTVVDGSETLTSCKQKIYFRETCGFFIHDTMIYGKLNFSHPETKRYHQIFEYVFVLSKGKPKTFNPLKDKRNATAGEIGNKGVNTFTERDGTKSIRKKQYCQVHGMRGNVWIGKTRGQEEMLKQIPHPAMMPRWLARDLIHSFSNSGDVVLDPFAGSGTTIIEAMKQHRDFIGIEVNAEYVENIITPEIKKQKLLKNQLSIERM